MPPISIERSQNPPIQNQKEQNIPSKIWNGFKVAMTFVYETPLNVVVFAIIGIALHFFLPKLALPFFAISASMMLTRLAVKIADRYHFHYLKSIQTAACQLCSKYPKLQLIGFIFAVAISPIAPPVGIVCGVAFGILGGIMIEIENYKKQQHINQVKMDNPSQNPALSQIATL